MTTDQTPAADVYQKALSRFWAKVNKTDSCWLWTGTTDQHGYGQFWSKGRRYAVHRLSYRLAHGDIPKGLVLDHLCHGWDVNCKAEGNWCRHRSCVNPDHLEAVTHRENLLRGHGVSGEAARRTYCPQGHPYDEANTYFEGGTRRCRACREVRKAAARTVPPSAERMHCPQGHPYDEENTYRRPNGDRSCRTCRREQGRQSRQSQPARRKAQVLPPVSRTSEAHRLALSEALGLGTGAPWDAIHDRVKELGRVAVLPPPVPRADAERAELLTLMDAYLTATHVARHDVIGEGGTCAGCALRQRLRRMADEAQPGHVCKPGASVYHCPTSGQTESDCHGGFTTCCGRPDLHQPAAEARQDGVRS